MLDHKRLRRIYRAEQLQVRKKRHVRYVRGSTIVTATRPNQRWSVDFLHDTLANGRHTRAMTLIDDFTCEALAVEVDFSLPTLRVLRILVGDRPRALRFILIVKLFVDSARSFDGDAGVSSPSRARSNGSKSPRRRP